MSRSGIVLAVFTLLIGACGGSEAAGDDGDTGVGGGADTSVGGTDTGGGGSDAVGHDGTPGDGTVSDGGSGDTSTGSDSTSGDVGSGRIACGKTTCDPASQQCCVTFAGGAVTEDCIDKGATCAGGTLDCTDSSSCPSGDVCCGERDPTTGALGAKCATSCGAGGVQLCSKDSECPTGERCRPGFGGVMTCRGGGGFDGGGFDTSGFDTSGFDAPFGG